MPEFFLFFRGSLKHEKLNNHHAFNKWVKTLLFLISAVLFVVLFGSTFDYSYALLLLPVLIFHELGHLLAMKLFGYRDLQVLFMPFGAAALGKEKANTSVLKKVIIYLAGPLPGILLAMSLALFPSLFVHQWIVSLAIMLIVINYLNLLPFMPLDGGQIINQVLFGRYPVAQFLFSLIGALTFLAAAYYGGDQILAVFGFFIGVAVFNQYGLLPMMRKLNNQPYKNKPQLIAKIFYELKDKPLRFLQKNQKVQTALPTLMQQKAKIHEILLGLFLYFAAIFGPLYVIDVYSGGMLRTMYQAYSGSYGIDEEKYTATYWQEKIDEKLSDEDRLDVYSDMLKYANSNPKFKTLLKDALITVKAKAIDDKTLYPKILKLNILMPDTENDYKISINDDLLAELSRIENGENTEYIETILRLSNSIENQQMLDKLIDIREVLEKNNDEQSLQWNLRNTASIYQKLNNFNQAEKILQELKSKSKTYEATGQLILLFINTNQLNKAEEFCTNKAITKLKQVQSLALENCGWVALLQKKFDVAQDFFSQSTEVQKSRTIDFKKEYAPPEKEILTKMLDSVDFNFYQNMMALEWSKNNLEQARHYYQLLVELNNKNDHIDLENTMDSYRSYEDDYKNQSIRQYHLINQAYKSLKTPL